jgi:hypothetical protein
MHNLGLKELVFGIPYILAIQEFWKAFELPLDLYKDKEQAFDVIELLSGQIIIFCVYFNMLSELIDSPDLSLMSKQLERECIRLFPSSNSISPTGNSSDIGTAAIRYIGRRLETRDCVVDLVHSHLSSQRNISPRNSMSSHESLSETLDNIRNFIKLGVDKEAIFQVINITITNRFKKSDSMNQFTKNLKQVEKLL